jgi:hypothetical protein
MGPLAEWELVFALRSKSGLESEFGREDWMTVVISRRNHWAELMEIEKRLDERSAQS